MGARAVVNYDDIVSLLIIFIVSGFDPKVSACTICRGALATVVRCSRSSDTGC